MLHSAYGDMSWVFEAVTLNKAYPAMRDSIRLKMGRIENKGLNSRPYRVENPNVIPVNVIEE